MATPLPADSNDPLYEGIREFHHYDGPVRESCDVVVVGSGPTGAVAAYNLAAAGLNTILVEAGPVRRPQQFTRDGGQTLAEVFYEGGTRVLQGPTLLPTMQARVLGGGSHVNSAICARTPAWCFDDWREHYGVHAFDRTTLDPHYDRVETFLGVRPSEEHALGRKNTLFRDACNALGYSSEPTPRNVVGCCGCAECFTGCPTRAKKSMDISYIPQAVRRGLKVLTSVEVRELRHNGRRALGVAGVTVDPITHARRHAVRIDAKVVVLAAGCLATPVLLQKSHVPDPFGLIGDGLQAHPGTAVMGLFPDPVDPWVGATQGYHSLHFLRQGFKLETLWAPPGVLAVRLPGLGHALKNHMASLKYAAIWDGFVATKYSRGRVRAKRGRSMNPSVRFTVDPRDMPKFKELNVILSEMFFAVGARAIMPAIASLPDTINDPKGIDLIRNHDLKRSDLTLAATHLFSTTRMGPDPANAVCRESGELHHLADCYVVDTGLMPRSPAVNPMLTAMAISDKLSLALAERLGGTPEATITYHGAT